MRDWLLQGEKCSFGDAVKQVRGLTLKPCVFDVGRLLPQSWSLSS